MKPKALNDNHISQSYQSCIGPLIVAIKGVLVINSPMDMPWHHHHLLSLKVAK